MSRPFVRSFPSIKPRRFKRWIHALRVRTDRRRRRGCVGDAQRAILVFPRRVKVSKHDVYIFCEGKRRNSLVGAKKYAKKKHTHNTNYKIFFIIIEVTQQKSSSGRFDVPSSSRLFTSTRRLRCRERLLLLAQHSRRQQHSFSHYSYRSSL